MRILPISDLHLERRSLPLPELSADFDILVCAGDMHEAEPEKSVRALVELAQGKPIVAVLGNHDHYRRDNGPHRSFEEVERDFAEAVERHGDAQVQLLSGGEWTVIDGVAFVGATLWSDWLLAGRWQDGQPPFRRAGENWGPYRFAQLAMDEAVHWRDGSPEYRAIHWMPEDAHAKHHAERLALARGITEAQASRGADGRAVVVTHYPALAKATDLYLGKPVPWWTPAFYGSDFARELDPDILAGVPLWISGHVHRRFEVTHDRTRFVGNPVEGGDFDPSLVIDLDQVSG